MNPRARGCLVLLGIVAFSVVMCGLFPFVILPGAGIAVALPLIEVPGEVVSENFIFGIPLTNTIIGTFVADALVLIFAFLAWRASRGWTREVPGRFQSWVEFFIGGLYSFLRGVGGERLRTAPLLWPLAATIFIFLLAGNWMKLLPGVETVGKMHCSHVGQIGYPALAGATAGTATLYVNEVFSSGVRQTEESEHACDHYFHGEWSRYAAENPEQITPQLEQAELLLADAQLELSRAQEAQDADALAAAQENLEHAEREVERQQLRLENAELIPALERELEDIRFQIGALEGAEATDDHSEEAVTQEEAVAEAAEADPETVLADLREQEADVVEALNMARTQVVYPTATLALDQTELESGAAPFLFHVTPFVRGPATDLSVAVTLALISIVAVQIYGVWALGPSYFEKFVNITALGNLGKKPLGAIDFVVGLIEIISEIGKIISLAFRLFGNLFAGGVALIALTFLVAFMVPMIMYTLELIIGAVQALVFAVLTVVFATQAMVSHHDDHEHAEEGHH